ncbi:MAG: 50S ribosomal protein L16 [archaeon]
MGLRPARAVRTFSNPPYTRVAHRVMKKAFIRGVPGSKMHTFQTGKRAIYEHKVILISKEKLFLRHNQLEAARVAANAYCAQKLGIEGYFLKVFVYPHQVLRENALATGAGADRFQSGMARSFGKPVSTAAMVKDNTYIMGIWVPEGMLEIAKEAFKRAAIRLSAKTQVIATHGKFDTKKVEK